MTNRLSTDFSRKSQEIQNVFTVTSLSWVVSSWIELKSKVACVYENRNWKWNCWRTFRGVRAVGGRSHDKHVYLIGLSDAHINS